MATWYCHQQLTNHFSLQNATLSCLKTLVLGLLLCLTIPQTLSNMNKPSGYAYLSMSKLLYISWHWPICKTTPSDHFSWQQSWTCYGYCMFTCMDAVSLLEVFCTHTSFACHRNLEPNMWIWHQQSRKLCCISTLKCESTCVGKTLSTLCHIPNSNFGLSSGIHLERTPDVLACVKDNAIFIMMFLFKEVLTIPYKNWQSHFKMNQMCHCMDHT